MAANPLQEKRGPKIGDAASLWNFTPSPGWSKDEVQILRLCLMKHGVGRWLQILEEGLLPGKLIQQLNGQTQRLLGQQSLAAYTGLQVDVDRIRADNEARIDVERKAGLIINTGPNLTKQMKEKLREEARVKYGLTTEQVKEVEEKIEEVRASLKDAAGPSEPAAAGIRLMSSDPSSLTQDQKRALLKRLHAQLEAAYRQLQKATQEQQQGPQQAGAARAPEAAVAPVRLAAADAKPAAGPECRPTNSNAENEAAAANATDSMELDPSHLNQADAASAHQPAAAPAGPPAGRAGKAGGAKRKTAGAGPSGGGSSGGGGRKARTPKPRVAELDADSDGDWQPASGGQRGRQGKSRRPQQQQQQVEDVDVEMQDSGMAGGETSGTDELAAANVRQLQEMGFSARQARQALEENGGDLDAALEWLAENCI